MRIENQVFVTKRIIVTHGELLRLLGVRDEYEVQEIAEYEEEGTFVFTLKGKKGESEREVFVPRNQEVGR